MEEEAVDRVSPMFWGLFSVGGFLVALLLPVFIAMNSLAYPFHLVPADRVTFDGARAFLAGAPLQGGPLSVLAPWLAKLFLVVLVGGCLFHGMHRLKYVLEDFGPAEMKKVLDPVMYGIAAAGTIAAAFLAFSFP
jgi:fumarate reductase subunit D